MLLAHIKFIDLLHGLPINGLKTMFSIDIFLEYLVGISAPFTQYSTIIIRVLCKGCGYGYQIFNIYWKHNLLNMKYMHMLYIAACLQVSSTLTKMCLY